MFDALSISIIGSGLLDVILNFSSYFFYEFVYTPRMIIVQLVE